MTVDVLEEPIVRIAGKYERACWERHDRDLALSLQPGGHPKGYYFDEAAGQRVVNFIERYCKHHKGEWAGRPLLLEPWQKKILVVVFGWMRADGTRRFRTAYIEIPRKNGKSELAGGVGLYLLVADDEPGAEVYSTATKKDQAKIVWGAAEAMVKLSPQLKKFVRTYKNNLSCERLGSKFEPLSAESGTMDGLNTHGNLTDEAHAHKDRHVYDVVATSMGSRRQPLNWVITTSGIYDPETIGWELHERAIQVLDGVIEDDTFFAFIAAADGAGTYSYHSLPALQQLDILCTCNTVRTTLIERLFREACATHATTAGIGAAELNGALITQIDPLHAAESARVATTDGSRKRIPLTNKTKDGSRTNGRSAIEAGCNSPTDAGEPEWAAGTSYSPLTDFPAPSTTYSTPGKVANALYAEGRSTCYAWITATANALFAGSSARLAIRESVYSATLRQVWSAHSDTCGARKADLRPDGSLIVQSLGDDWEDPATIAKANPNVGVSVKLEWLLEQRDRARTTPTFLNTFLRYHLDRWTEQHERWIPIELWNACDRAVCEKDLEGEMCWAALDLSSKLDITALVVCFPRPGKVFDFLFRFWCPEDTIMRRSKEDRVPYDAWARDGWIIPTPGNVVDYDFPIAELETLSKRFRIQETAYDPWNATATATDLQEKGLILVEFGQGYKSMSEPTKEFEKLVVAKQIGHATERGIHPVMRWMVSNVAVKRDPADNLKPDKSSAIGRIDGVVSSIMALGRALVAPDETSTYETNELFVL